MLFVSNRAARGSRGLRYCACATGPNRHGRAHTNRGYCQQPIAYSRNISDSHHSPQTFPDAGHGYANNATHRDPAAVGDHPRT